MTSRIAFEQAKIIQHKFMTYLNPAGEEGQLEGTSEGWKLSFKKSLQQKTLSLF